jgi:hypothetical protein
LAIGLTFIGLVGVERDSKKRTEKIEGLLRTLASGKPIPLNQFDATLREISKLQDTLGKPAITFDLNHQESQEK